ncbi:hypothetical protein FSP39_005217 [Pinctada imbricata]|uniref:Uncharacterized protein n=1 Tax=Pinctada imbricata TaxID=66713 RepID=A0AA88XSH6_PINIB|nr:hypothetical protein FSP39_005217 [Pinctada imbricata]
MTRIAGFIAKLCVEESRERRRVTGALELSLFSEVASLVSRNSLKMAGPQSRVAAGGFWSQPQATYSASTQALLKEMMQESKLTNFQQRHLQKSLKGGGTLPLECPPTSSVKKKPAPVQAPQSKRTNPRSYKPAIRTKDQMEAMGAYEKPDYTPMPNTKGIDVEKQKERLANIMAFGEDIDPKKKKKPVPQREPTEFTEVDRFDELQLEIEERRKFLNDMEKVGQGAKYKNIIETEISQMIREMEVIDKKRTTELERMIAEDERKKNKVS